MVSFRSKCSVRVPSFWGPMALAMGLVTVAIFSEPFWQNFFTIEAKSLNVTMKVGSWGVCTRLANSTGVVGPSTWCTSKNVGFELNFVQNATGINQFPTVADDATLFGLNSPGSIPILSTSATAPLIMHVVASVAAISTVLSLICPPAYLGSPTSKLYLIQKSGMLSIGIAIIAFILAIVTVIIDLTVFIPATARFNEIEGITAKLGNIQWFVLPGAILMIPGLLSVLMTPTKNEYADL